MPQDMDRLMQERIARNQATFREANERIRAAAGVYDVATPVPFICECSDPTCSEVVRLELDQYEEIRADSRHFLNVPGHQTAAQGVSAVVEDLDGTSSWRRWTMPARSQRHLTRETQLKALTRLLSRSR